MKCPGQDWRYWTGDVLFEVPCPECGYAVEFFKDEPRGRCPNCGHRFLNPGIDIGCAQWCGLSEQCLGLVPEPGLAGRGKEQALASRLIQAVREECQAQPARFAAALSVFRYAKWLVSREGGDPQVVLAAALLLEISHPAGGTENAPPGQGPAKVREILQRLNVDEAAVAQVCQIVACCRTAGDIDVQELRIVRDASVLARLFSEHPGAGGGDLQQTITSLYTPAAREAAQRAFATAKPPAGH